MEEWKDIEDFPNYEVSSLGNVRNKKKGNILKPIACKVKGKDYIQYGVTLCNPELFDKRFRLLVHRLVAQAFIPRVEGKDNIDHIDGKTENNHVSNLRWCNQRENNMNPNNKLRKDNQLGQKHITRRLYYEVRIDNKRFGKFKSLEEAIKKRDSIVDGEK
jgi:hypothetical protein